MNARPIDDRAQQIVEIARERLASSGGKASQLPQMIQRVQNEFQIQDDLQTHRDGGGMTMPNNMDAYIDRVLQMSGMTGPSAPAGSQAGGGAGDGMQGAPVDPVERGGPLPDAAPNPANEDDGVDEAGNPSNWQEYAKWVALGGTAYAAYKFMQKYGRQPTQADIGNVDGASVEGASDRAAVAHGDAPRTAVDESIDAIEGDSAKRPRLAPPQQQIEGPRAALPSPADGGSAVDDSIASTMETDDIDRVFQDRVEGRAGSEAMPGPNRFARDSPLPDDVPADVIEQATQRAQSGDIRGAVTMLRENGIELDDNLLRQLVEGANVFKSLQQRVGDVAGDAIRKGVRGAF